MPTNILVNLTACKLRLQVPSALRALALDGMIGELQYPLPKP